MVIFGVGNKGKVVTVCGGKNSRGKIFPLMSLLIPKWSPPRFLVQNYDEKSGGRVGVHLQPSRRLA